MFSYSLTDVDWQSTARLARVRSKTFSSDLQSNFVGGCGELTFKNWALATVECHPVLIRYWYPWLTGTADLYVGRHAVGVDVKVHQLGGDLLYPCHQALSCAKKGIALVVWAVAIGHGEVDDYEIAVPRNLTMRLLGWSTASEVASAPSKVLRSNDQVHAIAEKDVRGLDDLRAHIG